MFCDVTCGHGQPKTVFIHNDIAIADLENLQTWMSPNKMSPNKMSPNKISPNERNKMSPE